MSVMLAALVIVSVSPDTLILEERIDLYDPASMSYQGSERTFFDAKGRRLRLEVSNEVGGLTLLFVLHHDSLGRESEAIYFEDGSPDPDREVFTYSGDGRLKVTTYSGRRTPGWPILYHQSRRVGDPT